LLHSNLPQNLTQTRDAVYQALATANHAIWVKVFNIEVAFMLSSTMGDRCVQLRHVLECPIDGRQLHSTVNSTSMTTFIMLIESNINMTILQVRKFWRKYMTQLSKAKELLVLISSTKPMPAACSSLNHVY
jgi:hypothetical protein